MEKIYAELIRKGLKTIDEVPEELIDNVKLLLTKNGLSQSDTK